MTHSNTEKNDATRSAGILLPVFSLPSRYGAGCFSREAYAFIDRLHDAGQRYWQILPLNPAGNGDSPYMSDAAFAGNHYFISPDDLAARGLLTAAELDEAAGAYDDARREWTKNHPDDPAAICYTASNEVRDTLYRTAFRRWKAQPAEGGFLDFTLQNEDWLDDACLFRLIQEEQGEAPWADWPEGLRDRDRETMDSFVSSHREDLLYLKWLQYEFQQEWQRIREYASDRQVEIIGDIPIYVALESADCWAHPEIFQLGEDRKPVAVAGCPPDAFSEDGQLWGNPLYDWDGNTEAVLDWWLFRMTRASVLYDVIRIDHFRGLASYYAIPAAASSALNGRWVPGPGMKLFRTIENALGKIRFIAEDLGFLTDDVYELMQETGYPGMKVLQFAFDSGEDNPYLPQNYKTDRSVVYTGTHDNDTSRGWYRKLPEWEQDFVSRTLGTVRGGDTYRIPEEYLAHLLIRLAMNSQCRLAVIPMQDWLNLDSRARLNTPGIPEGSWRWQMEAEAFTPELARTIRTITGEYGRC